MDSNEPYQTLSTPSDLSTTAIVQHRKPVTDACATIDGIEFFTDCSDFEHCSESQLQEALKSAKSDQALDKIDDMLRSLYVFYRKKQSMPAAEEILLEILRLRTSRRSCLVLSALHELSLFYRNQASQKQQEVLYEVKQFLSDDNVPQKLRWKVYEAKATLLYAMQQKEKSKKVLRKLAFRLKDIDTSHWFCLQLKVIKLNLSERNAVVATDIAWDVFCELQNRERYSHRAASVLHQYFAALRNYFYLKMEIQKDRLQVAFLFIKPKLHVSICAIIDDFLLKLEEPHWKDCVYYLMNVLFFTSSLICTATRSSAFSEIYSLLSGIYSMYFPRNYQLNERLVHMSVMWTAGTYREYKKMMRKVAWMAMGNRQYTKAEVYYVHYFGSYKRRNLRSEIRGIYR